MNYFRKRRERQAKSNSGIYCPAANRSKIQYETKEKADHAVQYDNGGLVRSYYCRTCACWHTTSKSNKPPQYKLFRNKHLFLQLSRQKFK